MVPLLLLLGICSAVLCNPSSDYKLDKLMVIASVDDISPSNRFMPPTSTAQETREKLEWIIQSKLFVLGEIVKEEYTQLFKEIEAASPIYQRLMSSCSSSISSIGNTGIIASLSKPTHMDWKIKVESTKLSNDNQLFPEFKGIKDAYYVPSNPKSIVQLAETRCDPDTSISQILSTKSDCSGFVAWLIGQQTKTLAKLDLNARVSKTFAELSKAGLGSLTRQQSLKELKDIDREVLEYVLIHGVLPDHLTTGLVDEISKLAAIHDSLELPQQSDGENRSSVVTHVFGVDLLRRLVQLPKVTMGLSYMTTMIRASTINTLLTDSRTLLSLMQALGLTNTECLVAQLNTDQHISGCASVPKLGANLILEFYTSTTDESAYYVRGRYNGASVNVCKSSNNLPVSDYMCPFYEFVQTIETHMVYRDHKQYNRYCHF